MCMLFPVLFCIHFPNLTDIRIIFPKVVGPGSLFFFFFGVGGGGVGKSLLAIGIRMK